MSRHVDGGPVGESAVEASESVALAGEAAFEGAVESSGGHEHANDHYALVYDDESELYASVVPFVQQGLDRGEHCLYVLDESEDRQSVCESLRDGGVDVDAALESGALAFTSAGDTYLRERPFDPDAMLSYYEDVVTDALESWAGFRVVAGTNWIADVSVEAFMEYEGRVNHLFDAHDALALCHYDRRVLSPAVIEDVLRTHPLLINEGTICRNFYYVPPEQLFDDGSRGSEVDQMLGTLRDRAQAKTEVVEHKQFLQRLNEITADPERSFEEKLHALFDLGCEWFDLELGALNRVDPEADRLEVEYINGDHEYYRPGEEFPLSETYCIAATDIREAASIADPTEDGYDDLAVYEEFGVEAYLGTYIPLEGGVDRTFAFIASGTRAEPFTRHDRAYLELMGQWVKYELERESYERELEATVEQLEQSNDRLKQFAYAASHDLQEPLRMVSSYLQLLENRHGDDLDADAAEYIEFAVDGADRMREMVDALLAYAQVEQADGEFERVDCEAVLDRVTDDLEVRIEETGAEVDVGSLPTVTADPDQLEQLFSNLVSNGIKYNEAETPRVEVTAEPRADHWEFAVTDNGIGIEDEFADQIFDVFQRLHNDDEYAGTGIGLSLCQEIVDNHGGDVRVDSDPGEGTTFYVTLPIRDRV